MSTFTFFIVTLGRSFSQLAREKDCSEDVTFREAVHAPAFFFAQLDKEEDEEDEVEEEKEEKEEKLDEDFVKEEEIYEEDVGL